jgi:hypothetical protein
MGGSVRRYYGQWDESGRCPPGRVPWVLHRVGHHATLAAQAPLNSRAAALLTWGIGRLRIRRGVPKARNGPTKPLELGMGYVVKATRGVLEVPTWLSSRWPDGSRSLVCLEELATVFRTSQEASGAIADVPDVLSGAISFSVEPTAE